MLEDLMFQVSFRLIPDEPLLSSQPPYQAVTFHFPKGGGLIGVQLFLFLSIDYYKMLRK